jgi:hypothetical protein
VTAGNRKIFSKHEKHRFPEHAEILDALGEIGA